MEIRITFILSLLLHITFSALLLFSAGLQGESGKILDEKVIFIDLKSDAEDRTATVLDDSSFKTDVAKRRQKKEPPVIVDDGKQIETAVLKDPASDKRESGINASLTINTAGTPVIAESSDITFEDERGKDTNSERNKEEIIVEAGITGDKRGGTYKADVLKLISAAIEKEKFYPAMARRRGIEGTVYVSFRIGAEGEPGDINVLRSSGYQILDETTLKVVKKAAPYPYIDDRVEVPVTYRLSD